MTISFQGFKDIVQISKLIFPFFFIVMLQKYLISLPLIVIAKRQIVKSLLLILSSKGCKSEKNQ